MVFDGMEAADGRSMMTPSLSEAPDSRLSSEAALAPPRRCLSSATHDTAATAHRTPRRPIPSPDKGSLRAKMGLAGVASRTLGICLLLVTVLLWTMSNFLASSIFSDQTYDKPFFLVYVNSSLFAVSLLPMAANYLLRNGVRGLGQDAMRLWEKKHQPWCSLSPVPPEERGGGDDDDDDEAADEHLLEDQESITRPRRPAQDKLSLRETVTLSLEFCMLWFFANYFASACLEYTSVASVTILTSTSSMWTLVFCAVYGVEGFSVRKLMGVVASLVGVGLISSMDLSGGSNANRGSFPHKTPGQIAIGDSMALLSAVVYGMYVTVMKRRIGIEDRVDMRLFFGLVGIFNLVLLWPLFFILHWTNIEPFELPPTRQVWMVIVANSLSSFVSDIAWALAMLLTNPLVVTVGLSLTIPLSLVGEMIQYGQYSSFMYWIGAAIVFVSFLFINNESHEEAGGRNRGGGGDDATGCSASAAV